MFKTLIPIPLTIGLAWADIQGWAAPNRRLLTSRHLVAIKPQTTCTDDDVPTIVFATTYSRKLLDIGLSQAIFLINTIMYVRSEMEKMLNF